MKFLHVADLHIGKRVNGMALVEDQRHILRQVARIAVEEQVDALLVAGDIYDKASPSAQAVTVFDEFLSGLAAARVRVLAVPGNHDSAERIAYAQGLLEHQDVHFPPLFSGSVANVTLHDGYGPVTVWLLPFLKPGDVRRFFPAAHIEDDYTAALEAVMGACGVDEGTRNVVVAHQFVTARGSAVQRADEEIELGGIDNVDVSVFDAFDYVALGHVHRPQRVGRDSARYAGSPLKYSFSEARYDKSAVLVELGRKRSGDQAGACVETRLVPLEPLHDMRELRMSFAELLEQGRALHGKPQAHDYLHVTLTDEHPQLEAMHKVRELFDNAMVLDYDSVAVRHAARSARSAVDPDESDMITLFAGFYEEQTGTAMDDVQCSIVAHEARAVQAGAASL